MYAEEKTGKLLREEMDHMRDFKGEDDLGDLDSKDVPTANVQIEDDELPVDEADGVEEVVEEDVETHAAARAAPEAGVCCAYRAQE